MLFCVINWFYSLHLLVGGIYDTKNDCTNSCFGFAIAALPSFFFGYLIYDRAKDKVRNSDNKGKFTIIYRLLSKKTFDSYIPSNSGNITKGAAFIAYNNEKSRKNISIKAKKERVYYTAERVTELKFLCIFLRMLIIFLARRVY